MADPNITPELIAALNQNHRKSVRMELITDGVSVGPVPLIDGSITATFTAQVTRTGTIRVPLSVVEAGLLNPLTDRCVILTGIPGIFETAIFTGRVVSYNPTGVGEVTVQVADTSRDIVRARFEQPWRAVEDGSAAGEIERIVLDVSGDIAIDITQAPYIQNPYSVWEEDRAKALDDLASAMNCIWQGTRFGGLVVYPNPYSLPAPPPSVLVFRDGPGGNISSISETISTENMANSVTVVVERTDNSTPVRVTVRDEEPSSPSRWGGPFGKQNIIRKTNNPLNQESAKSVAFRVLNQSLALFRSCQITTPHFPLLDPGDVVALNWRNNITAQVIESITYPLAAIEATTISTRELRSEGDFQVFLGSGGLS